MIASLPMYWRPETAAGWRALWAEVQREAVALGTDLPDLTEPDAISDLKRHWLDPDLALSMTCGLPFRSYLKGRVRYLGTLSFGLDAPAGHYYSVAIRRKAGANERGDFGRLAFSSPDSQSGWAVACEAAPFTVRPGYREFVETGSHAASLQAVAEGRADLAYLDAVTWRLLEQFDPYAAQVEVIGRSVVTPGLPLITALDTDPALLRAAFASVVETWGGAQSLGTGPLGFHVLSEEHYYEIPIPPAVPDGGS